MSRKNGTFTLRGPVKPVHHAPLSYWGQKRVRNSLTGELREIYAYNQRPYTADVFQMGYVQTPMPPGVVPGAVGGRKKDIRK